MEESVHPQHEFECFMRYELPTSLGLTPSKQVACEIIFDHFSDCVKDFAAKSPTEFKYFLDSLRDRIKRIEKWKSPKTHMVVRKLAHDKDGQVILAKRTNGKPVFELRLKTIESNDQHECRPSDALSE
jgi:hypothetical protein